MKKLLVMLAVGFFLSLGVANALDPYHIEISTPKKEMEVPRVMYLKGNIINNTGKEPNERMIMTTVVLPASWPYYYIQGKSKLVKFGKSNEPFIFSIKNWIGSDGDYGKKFYIRVLLLSVQQIREMENVAERYRDGAIPKEEFENQFLSSKKYIWASDKITLYRAYE